MRRFREGIPKSSFIVAFDGGCDEHTVLNLEGSKPITYKSLEVISKGLGIPYKRLLALGRGEITSLTYDDTKDQKTYIEIAIRIHGRLTDETQETLKETFSALKKVIPIIYPHSVPEFTDGSICITLRVHREDAIAACWAFAWGRLQDFYVSAIQLSRDVVKSGPSEWQEFINSLDPSERDRHFRRERMARTYAIVGDSASKQEIVHLVVQKHGNALPNQIPQQGPSGHDDEPGTLHRSSQKPESRG